MVKEESKSKRQYEQILELLLEDPTRSDREISKKLSSYRQMVWRKKKELEDNRVIWGYTAVIDEKKLNYVMYIILMKTKPMSRGLVDLMIRRITRDEPKKQDVRVINLFYVNGDYDWMMRFSAPDHATARKYYDTLRLLYDDFLLEKPIMIDVNFCLISEGKNNPEIEQLYNFIPS